MAARSLVPDPENYAIVFRPDGTVEIRADCNAASGTYSLDEAALTLSLDVRTVSSPLLFCSVESLSELFLDLLVHVGWASLEDGRLDLTLQDDAGRIGFTEAGPADVGKTAEP